MENISDVMGFGPYAENNEGQPKLDNSPKKPIGLEGMLKYTKPDSIDTMDYELMFRPMFMNDTDIQGKSLNSADDKSIAGSVEKKGRKQQILQ